ncbi:unnamed protein product [Lampetra planeri]
MPWVMHTSTRTYGHTHEHTYTRTDPDTVNQKKTPPCGQDPKGFFGIKERTLSIGNQFDQESTHHEFDQWVGSGASSTERVGSTHLQLDRAGRLKGELRLTGRLDSSASGTQPSSDGSRGSTQAAPHLLCRRARPA